MKTDELGVGGGDWSNLRCSQIAVEMRPALCSEIQPAIEVPPGGGAHNVPEPSTALLLLAALAVGALAVAWQRATRPSGQHPADPA